jgi:hypothetical protein
MYLTLRTIVLNVGFNFIFTLFACLFSSPNAFNNSNYQL